MLLGARASLWRKTSPGRWYEILVVAAVTHTEKMTDLSVQAAVYTR